MLLAYFARDWKAVLGLKEAIDNGNRAKLLKELQDRDGKIASLESRIETLESEISAIQKIKYEDFEIWHRVMVKKDIEISELKQENADLKKKLREARRQPAEPDHGDEDDLDVPHVTPGE